MVRAVCDVGERTYEERKERQVLVGEGSSPRPNERRAQRETRMKTQYGLRFSARLTLRLLLPLDYNNPSGGVLFFEFKRLL